MEFLGVGLPELLVILAITLLIVGPNRLPEMAAQMARFVRAARQYSARISREFNETMQELEQEYDDVKGEWKEIGQGLEESGRGVEEDLREVDKETRDALHEAESTVDEASKPVPPPR